MNNSIKNKSNYIKNINEGNNHPTLYYKKISTQKINNRYNDSDNNNYNINDNNDNIDIVNNINTKNNYDNDNNIYDKENIYELKEKIIKLKHILNIEENKVKNIENVIKQLGESQKEKEENNLKLWKEFNNRENNIKINYQINKEEILDKRNKKVNIYEHKIKSLNNEINNIEYENMKINQKINELKNRKKNLESKYNYIEENLQNNILQNYSQIDNLKEQIKISEQEIIDKESAYEQKIKDLNIKLFQIKEKNNNKIEIIKNNLINNNEINENEKRSNSSNYNTKININRNKNNNIDNRWYKTFNDFYLKVKNRKKLITENNINENNNIQYLRNQLKILHNKSVELTRILSSKYEENEVLNKEINKIKENIKNNNSKNINNYGNSLKKVKNCNNIEINKDNNKYNINKITEIKIKINNYKNQYSKIKKDLDRKIIEHKLNVNKIIINYEKKIKKLIEKINNLKKLKNDYYQITDDNTTNLIDDI